MLTLSVPTSPGVAAGLGELTATLSDNDFDGATELFERIGSEIAAVIIEDASVIEATLAAREALRASGG